MKYILLLFLSIKLLLSSTILNHKLFFYENSTNLVLFCDNPYQGKIYTKRYKNSIKIKFKNLYFKKISKRLKSKFLLKYRIYRNNNILILQLFIKKQCYIKIIKDKFEIKIKISAKKNQKNRISPKQNNKTKRKSLNYFILIAFILTIGTIIFLIYDKKRLKIKIKNNKFQIKHDNIKDISKTDKMLDEYMKKASKD